MKDSTARIGTKLFIPTSILMIAYCIFHQYIAYLPYLFIVKIVLLASFIFQFISWIISMRNNISSDENDREYVVRRNLIIRLYLKSGQIITQIFCYYFALYLVLMLDKKSILYNYLLLFLFGLLLGHKITVETYKYLKVEK